MSHHDPDDLTRRARYYERFADEAARYFIHADEQMSLNRRALGEKTLAFRMLSRLQETIGLDDSQEVGAVFESTLARIHDVFTVDKSIVFLEKDPGAGIFKVAHQMGLSDAVVRRCRALFFEFSPEQLGEQEYLLVNRKTEPSEFVQLLRDNLSVRYFVCVPLKTDKRVFGYLLSGNDKEAYPFYPPFGRSHYDTFSAIAGFLSASFANFRLYLDLKQTKQQLEQYSVDLEERVRERTKDLKLKADQLHEEKVRSEELLLNILPRQTAIELRKTGQAQARRFEHVTVVFADIKSFSRLSAEMDAEEIVAELDQIFRAFDHIIDRNGLEKLKTIGDCYMCAGGIPEANESHALDAVRACIECAQYLEQRALERKRRDKPFFEMRFGVHTGPVVAGVVGSRKFAYDVWGDTVNVAAFLEAASEPGRVNLSRATYERIRHRYECEARGSRRIKHDVEVEMYFLGHEM